MAFHKVQIDARWIEDVGLGDDDQIGQLEALRVQFPDGGARYSGMGLWAEGVAGPQLPID